MRSTFNVGVSGVTTNRELIVVVVGCCCYKTTTVVLVLLSCVGRNGRQKLTIMVFLVPWLKGTPVLN